MKTPKTKRKVVKAYILIDPVYGKPIYVDFSGDYKHPWPVVPCQITYSLPAISKKK